MKISIDIDCSAEEARTFLGLPDFGPLQTRLVEEMQAHMKKAVSSTDMEALARTWMAAGAEGLQRMQALWAASAKDPGAKRS